MKETVAFGLPAFIGFIVTLIVFLNYRADRSRIESIPNNGAHHAIVTRNLKVVGSLAVIEMIFFVISISVLATTAPRPAWVGLLLRFGLIVASWIVMGVAVAIYRTDRRLEKLFADEFLAEQAESND